MIDKICAWVCDRCGEVSQADGSPVKTCWICEEEMKLAYFYREYGVHDVEYREEE